MLPIRGLYEVAIPVRQLQTAEQVVDGSKGIHALMPKSIFRR
jgi:hypothetical protein